MALLFMDSFDHYAIGDVLTKWTRAGSVDIGAYGRYGTNGARLPQPSSMSLGVPGNPQTIVFGFAFKVSDIAANSELFFGVYTGTSLVFFLSTNQNGSVNANGQALLGTTAPHVITRGNFHYIECKVKLSHTVGTCEVWVNGEKLIDVAGVDTLYGAGGEYTDQIRFEGDHQYYYMYIDDFYLLDTTGGVNDDILGDIRVECLLPDGVGNQSDLTPSAGANWQNVDEVVPDDDATYNESPTATDVDTYTFDDLVTVAGTVKAVVSYLYVRKTDAGIRTVKNIARPVATDREGATLYLSDDYKYMAEIYDVSPETAAAWTIAEVNGSEFGIKVQG